MLVFHSGLVQELVSFVTFSIDGGEGLEGLIGLLVEVETLVHVVGHNFVEDLMLVAHQLITELEKLCVLGLQEGE